MLLADTQAGVVHILSQLDRPSVFVLTMKTALGRQITLTQECGPGLRFASMEAAKGTVTWNLVRLPLAKKDLKQGQHHTPPKGYPTDKEDYAVPEHYEFPIDRKHIHAAISYFSKHTWQSDDHKKRAAKRILARAKKYGVDVSDDSDVARAAHGK